MEAELEGVGDPEVLAAAAQQGRILVTQDIRSMPGHFAAYLHGGGKSPGVFLVPKKLTSGAAIEELLLVWLSSEADEWENPIVWLPM